MIESLRLGKLLQQIVQLHPFRVYKLHAKGHLGDVTQ